MRAALLILVLLFCGVHVAAEPSQTDLSTLFPADDAIAGWTRTGELMKYRGDELFQMIDGGADIYHEYGFSQVLAGEYQTKKGKFIRLEINEMEIPEAAYGIYSFKVGREGKSLPIGQEALLEEYYLNIWKGRLLVTVAGSDTDEQTIQDVIAIGRYVDRCYSHQGDLPELAALLRGGPLPFSHPKYVRGAIGVMNSYIFDTEDIFKVREGMIGALGDTQTFVFRYRDASECTKIFDDATTKITSSHRYGNGVQQKGMTSLVDRDGKFIMLRRVGQDIVAVIGQEQSKVETIIRQLVKKLGDA